MSTSGRAIRSPLAQRLQHTRAGIASRLAANAIDVAIVGGLLIVALLTFAMVRALLTSSDFALPRPGAATLAALEIVTAIMYLFSGWAGVGRTIGKQVLGLRVIDLDGIGLRPLQAFARAVVCVLIGGPLLLWAAISRRNAALYDYPLRSVVIYDWSRD